MFVLKSDYGTAGDQEQAIQELIKQINEGQERCVLMGVLAQEKHSQWPILSKDYKFQH